MEGKGKSNIQVWRSSESAYGQGRLHECLQGSEERAAGRFIKGGSGKPLPKLSLALMGWFSLSTLPASLAFDPYQRPRSPTSDPSPDSNPGAASPHLTFQIDVRVLLWGLQCSEVGKRRDLMRKHHLGLPPSQMHLVGARQWGGQLAFSYQH